MRRRAHTVPVDEWEAAPTRVHRQRPPVQRETRLMQIEDLPLGVLWLCQLRLETLGRNMATAGGLETMRRLGAAGVFLDGDDPSA